MQNYTGGQITAAAMMSNAKSRSINAENPNGEVGKGGMSAGNLGIGRKGSPCISIPVGKTVTLAEIDGTGILQHFWITVNHKTKNHYFVFRNLILRMYWDGEQHPSVEVPLGDFFCNGFGVRCNINSMPIIVAPKGGMNCYFSMPFRKGAKITIENQHPEDIDGFFFQFNYSLMDEIPDEMAYFHAQWRREAITTLTKDYVIVDGIEGKGQYIGTFIALGALERYWWGEGEMKFYIDDDDDFPTICGTGLEDYFGGAWGFRKKLPDGTLGYETYCTPYLGYPFCSSDDHTLGAWPSACVPMHTFYRWHLPDPIRFEERLRVTIQQIGVSNIGLFERQDDYSSVAYWYQSEPHNTFPKLPDADKRKPR